MWSIYTFKSIDMPFLKYFSNWKKTLLQCIDNKKPPSFYLWKVDQQRFRTKFLDEMYHAVLNLRLRIAHEQDQRKEVALHGYCASIKETTVVDSLDTSLWIINNIFIIRTKLFRGKPHCWHYDCGDRRLFSCVHVMCSRFFKYLRISSSGIWEIKLWCTE